MKHLLLAAILSIVLMQQAEAQEPFSQIPTDSCPVDIFHTIIVKYDTDEGNIIQHIKVRFVDSDDNELVALISDTYPMSPCDEYNLALCKWEGGTPQISLVWSGYSCGNLKKTSRPIPSELITRSDSTYTADKVSVIFICTDRRNFPELTAMSIAMRVFTNPLYHRHLVVLDGTFGLASEKCWDD